MAVVVYIIDTMDNKETKPLSNRKKIVYISLLGLALIASAVFGLRQYQNPNNNTDLTQEELATLVKPSVVRIIQHVSGEIFIPAFSIDLASLKITIEPNKPAVKQKIDEYLTGGGVVINTDGYILTNSHVISTQTIKYLYFEEAIKAVLEEKIKNLPQEDLAGVLKNEQRILDLLEQNREVLEQQGNSKLSGSVFVLKPSSTSESLESLLNEAYQAEIISANDNFLQDEIDVGIIKIKASGLPSLPLGDSKNISSGSKIFVAGFPATAEFNSRNPLEPSFTQGVISAVKYSQSKDFSILQTDAKISQGSSGGPLFNTKGEVVGIITFQTDQSIVNQGDNFAFAIPSQVAKNILSGKNIANTQGNYYVHLASGLEFMNGLHCQKALAEFSLSQTNSDFATEKYLNPLKDKCNQQITDGNSVDGNFQEFLSQIKNVNGFAWFVVVGRMVLIVAGVCILWLTFNRFKDDEYVLTNLSKSFHEQQLLFEALEKKGIILPEPEQELHSEKRLNLSIPHPHIIDYVKEAREVGLKDSDISAELLKAGWSHEEISHALNYKE